MVAPGRYQMPAEMRYVQLLDETGWPPNVLDEMPVEDVNRLILYRNVKMAIEFGGNYLTEGKGG